MYNIEMNCFSLNIFLRLVGKEKVDRQDLQTDDVELKLLDKFADVLHTTSTKCHWWQQQSKDGF